MKETHAWHITLGIQAAVLVKEFCQAVLKMQKLADVLQLNVAAAGTGFRHGHHRLVDLPEDVVPHAALVQLHLRGRRFTIDPRFPRLGWLYRVAEDPRRHRQFQPHFEGDHCEPLVHQVQAPGGKAPPHVIPRQGRPVQVPPFRRPLLGPKPRLPDKFDAFFAGRVSRGFD